MKYHKVIRVVLISLSLLIVTLSLVLGCSPSSLYKNTTIPEIDIGNIWLGLPDPIAWFNDPSFEGYVGVEVIPNDKTTPNQLYEVSLFYKGQIIKIGTVSWDTNAFIPDPFLGKVHYKAKVFQFPIPKTHELYAMYFEQYSKPVSERHFNIQDYVKVTITK